MWIPAASHTLRGSRLGGSLLLPIHTRDPGSVDPSIVLDAAGFHLAWIPGCCGDPPKWLPAASNTLQRSRLGGSPLHPIHSRDPGIQATPGIHLAWIPGVYWTSLDPWSALEAGDPPSLDPWSVLEAAGIHLGGSPQHPIHSRSPIHSRDPG